MQTTLHITSVDDLQQAVRDHARIRVRGGGSKPALSAAPHGEEAGTMALLDLSPLSGLMAYDPGEYTFTAQANTPLAEIQGILRERGQYLPFDPPLAQAGATLGGSVAAGMNGPGRYRYGGVRDFLIGVRFVDGRGEWVQGGGQVVKNAAGFDFPKLMVGSLGRLGILTELTFKVFPAPLGEATLACTFASIGAALDALTLLSRSPFDVDALDIAPGPDAAILWIRLAGLVSALPQRLQGVADFLRGQRPPQDLRLFGPAEPVDYWPDLLAMGWVPQGASLVKAAVTPKQIRALDPLLAERQIARRYSGGGSIAWLACPDPLAGVDQLLTEQGLAGVQLSGPTGSPWLGRRNGEAFLTRIARALDPAGKFGGITNQTQ